ncbi:hypothetical protein E4T66_17420 [Sinimarinibacterium sp. CAU 1509]|uniref:hypothetical protein n=1 Tax=Sinimarinibacterium sp. CAU 1509 TaxID=2562283 RepID=UPI0010ACA1FF|nr:hypothetical protein [Sinimarinibacterium sp. CAU 1509]TJY57191.1 hypothetical protein E4T66_17420 [Sinimarinibacterium sp. CAU 1509]
MSEFKREHRYIVLKTSDVASALNSEQQRTLEHLCSLVEMKRRERGKDSAPALVVEHDWPEYEPTWQAIAARVAGRSTPGPLDSGGLPANDGATGGAQ